VRPKLLLQNGNSATRDVQRHRSYRLAAEIRHTTAYLPRSSISYRIETLPNAIVKAPRRNSVGFWLFIANPCCRLRYYSSVTTKYITPHVALCTAS
jgi:hypothetical protein